ncbi:exo-alpha-sialidase [Microlunatus soli]|uniref:BNR repeat-like domain-containing protein n=1 Tax=Microlunatus soli TaxID=630515 RepID=A0A1H1Z1V3_9ACTN|nr:exo-alpha-sialidase [Microlunatus soli]SDT27714.1 BNR repeat-like domain-containing protein [Microlunatus soli]
MTSLEHRIARRRLLAGSAAVAAGGALAVGKPAPSRAVGPSARRTPSLELDSRNYVELDADFLNTQTAHYPRIKKLPDGRYILFYQTTQHSWNVYWTTSSDLRHWEKPQLLFETRKILDGADDLCFATADGCVLDNGDILAVCSFRANLRFSSHMELDGLVLRRSTDNGRSWGPEQQIYIGANWEPFVHQTDTGEVQVYFTHSAPKVAVENTKGSTGVAIIRSRDRGRTWTPDVRDYPYAADRVAQQYTRTTDAGVKMFTDQMPSALQIRPGGHIALAMESHLADGNYMISLAHTSRNWPDKLAMDENGPADRQDNLFLGAGPYLARFPSGESVLAYNQASRQRIRLGDREAREFGDPEAFLPGNGFWGSIELAGPRQLVTTMANVRSDGNKIMIGVLDLVKR